MKYCKFSIALLLFCIHTFTGLSQTFPTTAESLPNVLPASPEAAALGKFGQIPVGNYRGVPDISIPLFTVSDGMIEFPVSLNYHAAGVKVEEMASWAGLGWALSAGGSITRSLKGMEDEAAITGYRYHGDSARMYVNNVLAPSVATQYELSVYRQHRDGQPDIFYFNAGGMSGKFFYTDSVKLFTSPRSDLQISYDDTNTGWVITDGKGIKYYFFNREQTTTDPFCKAGTGSYTNNSEQSSFSAWILTKIVDPLGNQVTFTYDAYTNTFKTKSIDTYNIIQGAGDACPATTSTCYTQVSVNTFRLKQITFSNGKIVFATDPTTRLDNPSDLALKYVTEYDLNNNVIRSYQLFTGFFTTNTIGGCDDGVTYRMRLDSVLEFGAQGAAKSPYRFVYNTSNSFPCRLSNAQDYYGYYNGKNNTTFARYKTALNGGWTGANKDVDSNYANAGVLQQVIYPTGGQTQFTFESNKYALYTPQGFDTNNPTPLVGVAGANSTGDPTYTKTFQSTFTFLAGDIPMPGYRFIKISYSNYCANPSLNHSFSMTLTGASGYSRTLNDGDTLHLLADAYTVTGTITTDDIGIPSCSFSLILNDMPYSDAHYTNLVYGGIRIKKIENFDEHGNSTGLQTYSYNQFDANGVENNISSGQYSAVISQSYYEYNRTNCIIEGANASCCPMHTYNSVSNYPLLNTGPSPIGYSNVTVYYGVNGSNGREQYTYTSYFDFPDAVGFTYPFYFASEYDWRKGLLTKKITYRYENGGYVPIEKKMTVYDFHTTDTTAHSAIGVITAKSIEYPDGYNTQDAYALMGLSTTYFTTNTEAFNPSLDTTIVYDRLSVSKFTTMVNSYAYSPKNFQLQKQTFINSKNEKILTSVTYPLDYSLTGTPINSVAIGLKNLQNLNSIDNVVEKSVQRSNIDGSNLRTISSIFNTYKPTAPMTDIIYKTEVAQPMTDFAPATVSLTTATMDTRYKPQIYFDGYNAKASVVQAHKINDVSHSYIWDYTNFYPVAETINGDSASTAATSFEADGTGHWTFAGTITTVATAPYPPTGTKYYNLTPTTTVSKSGVTSGNVYIISYWSKNGSYSITGGTIVGTVLTGKTINGWTYYEHKISATSTTLTISGTGSLDEVRLYPAMAQMTTYTYSPLSGMTSKCDAGNKITYYVYDGLQRLKWIKDQDGNIIKTIEYHYQTKAGSTL